MTHQDQQTTTSEEQPSAMPVQLGSGIATLAEAWLRDTATYAVVLLSLGVVLAGLSGGGARLAVGAAVGMLAAVVALTPTVRHWRPTHTWLIVLGVAAVDVAVILVLTSR